MNWLIDNWMDVLTTTLAIAGVVGAPWAFQTKAVLNAVIKGVEEETDRNVQLKNTNGQAVVSSLKRSIRHQAIEAGPSIEAALHRQVQRLGRGR